MAANFSDLWVGKIPGEGLVVFDSSIQKEGNCVDLFVVKKNSIQSFDKVAARKSIRRVASVKTVTNAKAKYIKWKIPNPVNPGHIEPAILQQLRFDEDKIDVGYIHPDGLVIYDKDAPSNDQDWIILYYVETGEIKGREKRLVLKRIEKVESREIKESALMQYRDRVDQRLQVTKIDGEKRFRNIDTAPTSFDFDSLPD